MYLVYFDENKYSIDFPFFYIGGILLHHEKITELEQIITQIQFDFFGKSILTRETELHGIDIFQGKNNFKTRNIADRVELLKNISTFIINHSIPIRIVCIDVNKHKKKYSSPRPEYNLGLMLMLEQICDYLDQKNDIGIVFGDYEKDEITASVLDFSQFKHDGKTRMYLGRPLGRLKDTIYFTQSHHSRFLQIADIIIYLANRYENAILNRTKWHDLEVSKIWQDIKTKTDCRIKLWPKYNGATSLLTEKAHLIVE